jgi:hypothetical protein
MQTVKRRKIMNAVTNFVAIVSISLALVAGSSSAGKEQAQVNLPQGRSITPSKIALNHNETMVSDAGLVQVDDLSQWLTSLEAFFFNKHVPGGCDEWGCGTNHNETMVSETNS